MLITDVSKLWKWMHCDIVNVIMAHLDYGGCEYGEWDYGECDTNQYPQSQDHINYSYWIKVLTWELGCLPLGLGGEKNLSGEKNQKKKCEPEEVK